MGHHDVASVGGSRCAVRAGRNSAGVLMTTTTEREAVTRWSAAGGEELRDEVLGRLLAGGSLNDLGLGERDGRVGLRGLRLPPPERLHAYRKRGWVIEELGGLLVLRGLHLADLDLSGGSLEGLRFFATTVANCRFDDARCQDWRLWATDVEHCSFVGADLRKAVLGSWYENRENVWRHVNFTGANLRGIVSTAATFEDCDFSDAHLAKIDFQSSGFVRCRFAGLLREVIFYDHGHKTGKAKPNRMIDIDFSGADLRMVEFRHLDLDRVTFPNDASHLVVKNYRCVLERALSALAADESSRARRLCAVLELRRRWAGAGQVMGVFNERDFVKMGNEDEARYVAVRDESAAAR